MITRKNTPMILKHCTMKTKLTLFYIFAFTFISIDCWGQSYTTGYPTITNTTETTADVVVSFDTNGWFSDIVILPSTETAPTVQNVIDWSYDGNGGTLTVGTYGEITTSAGRGGANPVTFNATNLISGTDYIAYIVTSPDWSADNAVEQTAPTQVPFSTVAIASPVTVSTFSPTLGNNASISDDIILTFSEDIELPTTGTPYYISIYSDDDVLFQQFIIYPTGIYENSGSTGSATISGSTLTITHDTDFTNNTSYYVTIDAGAFVGSTNGGDFEGLVDGTPPDYYFTAAIPPTITFTPTNGSEAVNVGTTIKAVYSMPIRLIGGSPITDVASLITLTQTSGSVDFTATLSATSDTITITPTSYLDNSTTVNVTIAKVEGNNGQAQTEDQTLEFFTGSYAIWTGGVDSDFKTASNWERPFSEDFSILVKNSSNDLIVSDNHTVNNIIIEPGANVVLESTATITVNGDLVLQSSNSNTTGNANLLNKGTINMNSGEMIAYQSVSTSNYDYYISSPNNSSTGSSVGGDVGMFTYDINTGGWSDESSSPLTPGVGYITRSTGETLTFTGDFNNGTSYGINATRTSANYGWNLVGNPYPCSIDWNLVSKSSTMKPHFYMYLNNTTQFATYNGTVGVNTNSTNPSHIPPLTAFWVQVAIGETSGTVTIESDDRVASNYTYLKNATTSSIDAVLKLTASGNGVNDEIAILFNQIANDNSDNYDAIKRFAAAGHSFVELYTINNNRNLAIDALNTESSYNTSIALGYRCYSKGDYSIKLNSLIDYGFLGKIELIDTYLDKTTTLEEGTSYPFYSNKTGDITDRFVINITNGISTETPKISVQPDVEIYNSKQTIFINAANIENGIYTIYDISGRILDQAQLNSSTLNQININYQGAVIVKVTHSKGANNQKLILN